MPQSYRLPSSAHAEDLASGRTIAPGETIKASDLDLKSDHDKRLIDEVLIDLGSGKQQGTSGHPEVELALAKLYHATGNAAYLDLAGTLVDRRGQGVMRGVGWMKAEYHQDRVPVREEDRIEGHSVRAVYLNAGVADLYLETGEEVRQFQGHSGLARDGVSKRGPGAACAPEPPSLGGCYWFSVQRLTSSS